MKRRTGGLRGWTVYLKLVLRIKRPLLVALLSLCGALTGCLTHKHTVARTRVPDVVYSASLDQLITQVNGRFDSIQTMNAAVDIAATTGGGRTGEVTNYPTFSGYILMKKPRNLRVLLQVPIVGSRALDMVSDGDQFKLYIPQRNRAIEGNETVTSPSKNGLENLRPAVFFDSLLIQGLRPGQIISETSDTRLVRPADPQKEMLEEPDYELAVLAEPEKQVARTIRVIRIGRIDLLPFAQDIYDAAGHVITKATYSGYQTFDGIQFPTKIVINRPVDEYTLTLTMKHITFNGKLEPDTFELKIPETVPVERMK